MFDYTKVVLAKVSFDANLFSKELQKALNYLLPYEIEELKVWINSLVKKNPELNPCLVYLKWLLTWLLVSFRIYFYLETANWLFILVSIHFLS